MKTLSVTRKTLIELGREPLLLGLLLIFPVVLVGFYYVAFGQTEDGLASFLKLQILNEDEGQLGGELIDFLSTSQWEETAVFDTQLVTDLHEAEIALIEHKVAMLLVIPADFSADLAAGTPVELTLAGDPNSDTFTFAQSFLNGLVREFVQQQTGWQDDVPPINYEFLPGTGTMSDFDFGVGGIIIFGVMFLMITTATVMVRENVTGTLRRLQMTGIGAGTLLVGVALSQMVAAAIQAPITFGVATLLGFQNNGSLLLAMSISLLVALSAIGVGLVVACFARNDGEATNLASIALIPMVFLSGALFPMPATPLFTVGQQTVELYDVLPTTHATEAMRQVLIFGTGPGGIIYELVMMTILSLIMLAIGVVLYQKLRLQRW